ncbi:MAG: undecaprenyl-phosphate glucose phosphotransferase [Piscinibacter sp.]|nr:undecaprenyl-phosphate glucose phosphotransferase [Piscinibacter sp.]
MLQTRTSTRQFDNAPLSASTFVAAVVEPLLSVACYIVVAALHEGGIDRPGTVLCLLVFALTFPGVNRFRARPLNALVDVTVAWGTLLAILGLCGFATDSFRLFSSGVLLQWAVATPVLHWLAAYAGCSYLRWKAAQPGARRAAVVIGGGPLGVRLARALEQERERGHDFLGFYDDRRAERLDPAAAARLLGTLDQVRGTLARRQVDEVYIALPLSSQPRITRLLASLQDSTASVYLAPDVFGISIIQGRLQDLGGVPVVGMLETPFTGVNELVKRLSDIVLASLILLLIAPLLAVIAIGVRLDSPGPVIFRQRRNGLNGEEIVVWKFRSMTARDDGPQVTQARRNDPRITRLGAFLRRTSLDELPQFVNVLQGRMSIVGPRPHAVAHNEQYRRLVQAYMLRHKVRPGITGWAQVNGLRGETDTVDKMQARVEYDLEYLRNWSIGFDLRIIARTLKLVLFDRHAY